MKKLCIGKKPRPSLLRFSSFCFILLAIPLMLTGCGPEGFQANFLASWSPDGTRAALVPLLLDNEETESGIWIYEVDSRVTKQIVRFGDGWYCFHPQWSPLGDELLFGLIAKDGGKVKKDGDHVAFSVWAVRTDGQGLRKVADSIGADDTLYLPNALAWGGIPDTVLYQKRVDEKMTAVLLDLATGHTREFLPSRADYYSLEPSPDRRQVVALLYDREKRLADVYLGDFILGDWQRLDRIGYDEDKLASYSQMIYWSADSAKFLIPEMEKGLGPKDSAQHFVRIYDARTGQSRRLHPGNPTTALLWNAEGSAFVFSGHKEGIDGADAGIYRVDAETGYVTPLVTEGENRLLSWNPQNGRVYFYRTDRVYRRGADASDSQTISLQAIFSCASDGSDLQELRPPQLTENSGWCLSPDGRRLLLFRRFPPLSILDLGSGSIGEPLLLTAWQKAQMVDGLARQGKWR